MNSIELNNQPKIILGGSSFKNLLLESNIMVDKTLLIKTTLETPAVVFLITRPRRWGKSINLDMLKTFFEVEVDSHGKPISPIEGNNRKFFMGGEIELDIEGTKKLKPLKIADHDDIMKYQGQYPIILLDFKDIEGNSYQEIEDSLRKKVTTLFTKYLYLTQYLNENSDLLAESQKRELSKYLSGEFSKVDLKYSLRFLSEILYKHFKREVYVLIDEYDATINYACSNLESKEIENVMDLFGTILGAVLKGNNCLKKGILTGILRVAKTSLFSDLNNVIEYNLLGDRFTEYYGFTQEEVNELLKKANIDNSRFQTIKEWYNGYTFGGQLVYNPWSIMNCLS